MLLLKTNGKECCSIARGRLLGAKPPTPSDYELFPGVGYYKFHTDLANGFEDASSRCTKEGGHLAISTRSCQQCARFPESELKTVWAFVGFHDRFKEGEYVTIYGEPLNTTGFTRWSSAGQPDDYNGAEDCGSVHQVYTFYHMIPYYGHHGCKHKEQRNGGGLSLDGFGWMIPACRDGLYTGRGMDPKRWREVKEVFFNLQIKDFREEKYDVINL
ncbi:hypothetical protein J437_LFUL017476 [Ladona fulva]|uniref:C-type lectin domain-containing protein n=1 Tax=Ladona fulva TaxID=123851 RepID=A0A8K0KLZ6_LADFU|nr:hypothetical protein J437_LFUL017476 [Ladona fulva]